MKKLTVYVLLVALLLIMDQVKESTCQCSSFTYRIHPTVPLDCRPFSNTTIPTWQLVTRCGAERNTTNTPPFEVQWFQRDSNGVIHEFPNLIDVYNPNVPRAAKGFGTNLRNMPFNESMLGQYWCQVYLGLLPVPAYSDSFTILRPEEYDNQLPVCNTRQLVNADICLDTPPPAPVPSSTQAPPSLIPSIAFSSINKQTTTSTLVLIATAIPSSTTPGITTPMATISTHVDLSTATTVTAISVTSTPSDSNTTLTSTPVVVGTSSRDLAILHSIYCTIIVLIGILSVSVIAITCCKERLKKIFKRVPVEMLETRLYTTPLNTKKSTHQVGNNIDTQVICNRADPAERNEYYKSLEAGTMNNIEQQYTTVYVDIH